MLHYRALLCWDLHSACCIFPFALFIVLEFEQIISMQGISDLFEQHAKPSFDNNKPKL